MLNVKQEISWFWQNAERILIVIFFLTFSLNIRKVFLTPFSFLNGGFNEYMTMSFGWADLLMIGTIIIYNIKLIISQFRQDTAEKLLLENVIQNKSSVIRNYYSNNVSRETFYLLIFLGWVGLSIFWSQYRSIAVYRFLTLAEIVLFATIVVKCLKNSRWLKIAVFTLVLNGLAQALLGIAQFVHNASLGLRFIGESILGPNIDGVAKILINGEKHIRAYGTFPHPNILAGFLLITLFLILAEIIFRRLLPLYKGEAERGSDSNHQNLAPSLSLSRRGSLSNVSHETFLSCFPGWILVTTLLLALLGFGLTFSRSAFLGFLIGFLALLVGNSYMRSPSRILKNNFKFFVSSIITLILITILLLTNTSFFSSQSLQERQSYQYVSYETISRHPAKGVGIGQFILNEYNINPNLKNWQYQPVHNSYLLLFSELGIVGLILFLLFLTSLILKIYRDRQNKESYRLTKVIIYCIVFSFLAISFFDHYFWDIKQGMIIFALPLIFLFARD